MRRVDEILEMVKALSKEEREALWEEMEQAQEPEEPEPPEGAYSRTMALAGKFDSDWSDVSSDKYKHVAAAILGETAGE